MIAVISDLIISNKTTADVVMYSDSSRGVTVRILQGRGNDVNMLYKFDNPEELLELLDKLSRSAKEITARMKKYNSIYIDEEEIK